MPGTTQTGEPLGNIPGVAPRIPPGFGVADFATAAPGPRRMRRESASARRRRRSSLSLPAAAGLEAGCRGMTHAIEVRNVYREFQQRGGMGCPSPGARSGRGDVLASGGRRAGGGGRVRLRQINACPSHHGPAAADLGRDSGGWTQPDRHGPARTRPTDPTGVPGPVLLAQPAPARSRHRRPAAGLPRQSAKGEADRSRHGDAGARWNFQRDGRANARPALRRPAAARRHRACARAASAHCRVRRAHQRAGRFRAGADPQSAGGIAAGAWTDLSLHQPQPGGGGIHRHRSGGDVSRPDRRAGAGARPVPHTRRTPTRRRCWPPC